MLKVNENIMMNNEILMSNNMPFDETIEDIDVIIYMYMKKNIAYNRLAISSISLLAKDLNINIKKDSNKTQDIKDSINRLCEYEFIGVYDYELNEINVYDLKPNDIFKVYFGETDTAIDKDGKTHGYFPIEYTFLKDVLEANKKVHNNKFKFIRYALCIKRVCNYSEYEDIKRGAGYMAHKLVSFFISNRQTSAKYNELLSDSNIIYYNNEYVSATTGKNLTTYFGIKSMISIDDFNKVTKWNAESSGYIYQSKEEQSKKHNPKRENKEEFIQEDNENSMLFEELSEKDQELLLELEREDIEDDEQIDLNNINDTLEYACKLIDENNDTRKGKNFYNKYTNSWGNDNPFLNDCDFI